MSDYIHYFVKANLAFFCYFDENNTEIIVTEFVTIIVLESSFEK